MPIRIDGTTIRYFVAGLANTLVGYLAFLCGLHVLHLGATSANVLSYIVGLACAYFLNRLFVFKGHDRGNPLAFVACFALAYAANLVVLHIALRWIGLRPEFAQVFAMGAYTVLFYLLNRHVVFRSAELQ